MKPLLIALILLRIFSPTLLAEAPSIISTDGEFDYADALVEITLIDHIRRIKITVHDGQIVLNSTIEGAPNEPFLAYWDSALKSVWWATGDTIKTYHLSEHSTAGHRYTLAEGIEKLDPPQHFIDAIRQNLK